VDLLIIFFRGEGKKRLCEAGGVGLGE